MSTNRENLHRLTDELPEHVAGIVLQFARAELAMEADAAPYLPGRHCGRHGVAGALPRGHRRGAGAGGAGRGPARLGGVRGPPQAVAGAARAGMTEPYIEPAAAADLLAIWAHMAGRSVTAADAWLAGIEAAIATIGLYPEIGAERPSIDAHGLRYFTPARHQTTIVYRAAPAPVRILRVAGRGRDLGALLGDEG